MSSIGNLFLDLNLNTKPFDAQMSNVGNYAQKSMSKSFGGIGKIMAGALSVAVIGAFGKSCIDLGSNLAEVQNVVDVVFPSMGAQVNQFAQNAIGSFGLSETSAKKMVGTFGAMSKAFGFSETQAYGMSTALTGLAGDVSSFYNISADEAYTKLKSVFSGETETLKDLGIVMTQSALDSYAMANGFGKTTAKMSEQEKVALRLSFVQQQLSAASGDFARTSDSWANKTRVLSLNFQSLKASIGQGLINVLSPVVSLINNIIVKLNKAVQYFVAFTSLLSGKKVNSSLGSVSSSIDKASSGASNLTNNVAGAGKAAKKAAKEMGALASIDEINNISTSKGESGSSDSGGSVGGDFGGGLDMSGANSAVPEIDTSGMEKSIEKMKSMWNGFTAFLSKNKVVIISLLSGIVAGFAVLGVLKNLGAITKGFTTMTTVLKAGVGTWNSFFGTLSTGGGIMNALTAAFGTVNATIIAITIGVTAVVAALVYLYQTSESFRNLVNEAVNNLFTILSMLWTTILQPLFSFLADVFVTVLVPIATFIATIFVSAVEAIFTILLSLWNNVLAPIAKFLVNVLAIAIQGVIDIFASWKPHIETLFSVLNWIWQNMLQPLVDFIVGIFCNAFKEWGKVIENLIPGITQMFQGLVDFFVGVFTLDVGKAWGGIIKIFEGFDNFLTGIFKTDWSKSFGFFGECLNVLFSSISDIWSGIKKIFSGVIDFITGIFTGNWKKAWNGVVSIFKGIFQMIVGIAKAPINAVIGIVNSAISGLNKIGFTVPDWVPIIGGSDFKVNIPKIPMLAQGGYVEANTPQLAMIGDNRHQGEIVAPEGKMFEVMISALEAYLGKHQGQISDAEVIVSILYEILEAIKGLRLVVDSDSLNQSNKDKELERSLRTGKLVLK